MADTGIDIKVSVIIPVYNVSYYLEPALDSVIDQTLREIEIICIDDGSTDSSLEILKKYQKADDRIRIATEQNAGPARARNNGLARARGRYVMFLDADDFYELTLLERLYNAAENENLDITIADYDNSNCRDARFERRINAAHEDILKTGRVISRGDCPDELFSCTTGAAWNKLFRRSFIQEKELSFIDVRMFEDVYFTLIAMAIADRIGYVDERLIHHRIYPDQSRAKTFKKYYSCVPEVYAEVREALRRRGLYSPLSTAYLNASASMCYRIYNLLGMESKHSFYDLLKSKYIDELGWRERAPEDFESSEVCDFIAGLQFMSHNKYFLKRSKGAIFNYVKLRSLFRRRQSNRLLGNFFAGLGRFFKGIFNKIFRRKKKD